MTWLFLCLFGAVMLGPLVLRRDIFSPARVYLLIYSLLLAVYSLNLSRLQTPWSITSIILFYGASAMFVVGCLIATLAAQGKFTPWKLNLTHIRRELESDAKTVDWNWLYKVFLGCTALFILSFLVSAFLTGGVPMLTSEPDEARIAFFSATLPTNYGLFFGPIGLMLSAEILLLGNPTRFVRRICLICSAIILVLYFTMVTRFELFRFFLFFLVFYHYSKQSLGLKQLMAGFSFFLILFFAAFFIRVNANAVETFNEAIQVKLPKNIAWASNIYAYVCNDFWNFDFAVKRFIEGDHFYPFQYGSGMARGILSQMRLEVPLIEGYGFDSLMNESIRLIEGLNTVIYVWHFYKDFGIAGTFLACLLIGLLTTLFYMNTMRTPTVFRLSIWAILAGTILLSFHVPLWEFWFFYLNLTVLTVAHKRFRIF